MRCELFQMNVDAYPNSANTYDSLSDALLAAGNRKEALRIAEKALEVLDKDKSVPDEFRAAIKESAEKRDSRAAEGVLSDRLSRLRTRLPAGRELDVRSVELRDRGAAEQLHRAHHVGSPESPVRA